MNVVLDTNQYFGDFYMKGPRFQALFSYLERTRGKLLIPTVVKSEMEINFKEQLSKSYERARILGELTDEEIKLPDENKMIKKYSTFLEGKLKNSPHIEEVPHAGVKLSQLLDRALKKSAPFSESGAGFKDAVIWEVILGLVSDPTKQNIAFITSNWKDFGKDSLSLLLESELESRGSKIEYFNTLDAFLTQYAEKLGFFNQAYIYEHITKKSIEDILPTLQPSNIFIDIESAPHFAYPEFESEIENWSYAGHGIREFYIYSATKSRYRAIIEITAELEVSAWTSWFDPVFDDYGGDTDVFYGDASITFDVEIEVKSPHKLKIKKTELWQV